MSETLTSGKVGTKFSLPRSPDMAIECTMDMQFNSQVVVSLLDASSGDQCATGTRRPDCDPNDGHRARTCRDDVPRVLVFGLNIITITMLTIIFANIPSIHDRHHQIMPVSDLVGPSSLWACKTRKGPPFGGVSLSQNLVL